MENILVDMKRGYEKFSIKRNPPKSFTLKMAMQFLQKQKTFNILHGLYPKSKVTHGNSK
jgi:hypothetical protein